MSYRIVSVWITFSLCMFCCRPAWSQTANLPKVLGSFVFFDSTYTFEFVKLSPTIYTIAISKVPVARNRNEGTVDASNNDGAVAGVVPYQFSTFTPEVFHAVFAGQMRALFGVPAEQLDFLRNKATEVYAIIKSNLDFLDDEPVTGYLRLTQLRVNSYLQSNTSNYYRGSLSDVVVKHTIHALSVETSEGAIKNIELEVISPVNERDFKGTPLKTIRFKNYFPISISGKFDPEKFSEIYLYAVNCNSEKGLTRYVKLGEFLDLAVIYAKGKEDYSPVDKVLLLKPELPIVELRKEKRSAILSVAAFTDLSGLDDDMPNGLVQIDLSRRFNINTKYKPLTLRGDRRSRKILDQVDLKKDSIVSLDYKAENRREKKKYLKYLPVPKDSVGKADNIKKENDPGTASKSDTTRELNLFSYLSKEKLDHEGIYYDPGTGVNRKASQDIIKIKNLRMTRNYINWFGGIEFRLLFSKLDENNRLLDSSLISGNKVAALSLYQHQLSNLGFRLQLVRMHFPQLKFQWNVLDMGANWSRARLAAASNEQFDSVAINSNQFVFGTSVRFNADGRYSLQLGVDYVRWLVWSKEFSLSDNNGLLQPYIDAYLWTNEESRIFFRFRWTHQRLNRASNFTQVQLGYTIDLFKQNK